MTRGILTAMSIVAFWVLTAAVLIFVGLTGNALLSANDRLETTDKDLTSVRGHTDPLTEQVHIVNNHLVDIESALQPIHGQADQLNPILIQVNQTLTEADPIVKSVEGHAANAEQHLVAADGHARTVAGNASQASGKVTTLQSSIVTQVLNLLVPIESDLSSASGSLSSTQVDLLQACNKIGVLALLSGNSC